jgi:hypothetical protein
VGSDHHLQLIELIELIGDRDSSPQPVWAQSRLAEC